MHKLMLLRCKSRQCMDFTKKEVYYVYYLNALEKCVINTPIISFFCLSTNQVNSLQQNTHSCHEMLKMLFQQMPNSYTMKRKKGYVEIFVCYIVTILLYFEYSKFIQSHRTKNQRSAWEQLSGDSIWWSVHLCTRYISRSIHSYTNILVYWSVF